MHQQPADRPSSKGSTASEAGIATVWAVTWMFVCLTVGGVGLVLGYAEARQHQVDGSADLVAIAAASALQRGDDPCRTAFEVAGANNVALSDCRTEGLDVVVKVQARLDLPFGLRPWVHAHARAGPAP